MKKLALFLIVIAANFNAYSQEWKEVEKDLFVNGEDSIIITSNDKERSFMYISGKTSYNFLENHSPKFYGFAIIDSGEIVFMVHNDEADSSKVAFLSPYGRCAQMEKRDGEWKWALGDNPYSDFTSFGAIWAIYGMDIKSQIKSPVGPEWVADKLPVKIKEVFGE